MRGDKGFFTSHQRLKIGIFISRWREMHLCILVCLTQLSQRSSPAERTWDFYVWQSGCSGRGTLNMDFWYCILLRCRLLNCLEFTWCGGLPRGQPQHFQAPNPADVQQVAHAPLCGVQQVILESLALSVSLGTTLLSRWFSSYVVKCSVWWKEERFGFKGKPRIQQCCTSKSVRTASFSWWSW